MHLMILSGFNCKNKTFLFIFVTLIASSLAAVQVPQQDFSENDAETFREPRQFPKLGNGTSLFPTDFKDLGGRLTNGALYLFNGVGQMIVAILSLTNNVDFISKGIDPLEPTTVAPATTAATTEETTKKGQKGEGTSSKTKGGGSAEVTEAVTAAPVTTKKPTTTTEAEEDGEEPPAYGGGPNNGPNYEP